MKIRPAKKTDADRLCEISQCAYGGYASRMGKNPAPMDMDFHSAILAGTVWVLDGPPVLGLIVMQADGDDWFIESVAVDPVYHGQGFGAALLSHAEDAARQAASKSIFLYTNTSMTENLSFYPAHGYHESARRHEDGFNRIYFRKNICA